ncbi:MAG TPA: glycosyltransferase family 2 protein [Syntrophales bacterium]|nr:glycosyltransferase family 2 protein [Syntrophales bacterium]
MILISYLLIVIGIYISIYITYDLILLLSNYFLKDKDVSFSAPTTRFGIIIPAHNEELLLDRLLKSISDQDYPVGMAKAVVVADNCSDNTAKIGLASNARVLERSDDQHRGKGYAIKFALETLDMSAYDAIFIIDADSIIKNDIFTQLDKALRNGNKIIQCYNGVANPGQSWFTRLLDVSRTVGNEILQPAKQKLGLSSNLMGNGMCFASNLLMQYGWDAFTVGEDWEYYAKLVQAGETVAFANKARVYHQESSSLKQATSQRMRWSSGRFAVAWQYGIELFYRGLLEGSLRKMDASLPLLFPNPSLGMNITLVGIVLSLIPGLAFHKYDYLLWFLLLVLVQTMIFLVGIMHTRDKLKNFLSLFAAPLFLIWKMGVDAFSAAGLGRKKWIRTERKL